MDVSIYLNEEVLLSSGILNSVVIVLLLSILFVRVGKAFKKADPNKPSVGIVLIFEIIIGGIDAVCKQLTGDEKGRYGAFIGTLVFYLITANLLGLIGLTTPTSNYTVTLSLALFSLVYLNFSGAKAKGLGGHLKDTLLGDFPALMPLNLIGELSKILSLSFRLFGNILSGGIITAVLIQLLGWFIIPLMPVLNLYFDVFSGLLQTMIFTFLLMIWLGDTLPTES